MTLPPRFSVCPHDTAKGVDRWALFHTLINKQIKLGTRFLPSFDFKEFDEDLRQPGCLWGYLNPAQFLAARRLHGGEALVRPVGRPDRVYLVASAARPVPDGPLALSAVDGYLFRVFDACVRGLISRDKIEGAACATLLPRLISGYERRKAKSYAEVLSQVERGDAHLGVTYNEHFDDLSALVRGKFQQVAVIDIGLSHVVVVNEGLSPEHKEELRRVLIEAPASPEGKKILDTFGTTGFEPVPPEPYELLAQILAG